MRVCLNARPHAGATAEERCTNAAAESSLEQQAARIKQLNPYTRVLLYRNTELGLSSYHDQCLKMYDPSFAGYWLQNRSSSLPFNEPANEREFEPCLLTQNASSLVQDQYFRDFRNASAAEDFVENVVGHVRDSPNADGVWCVAWSSLS
jgi:hypothetical protein